MAWRSGEVSRRSGASIGALKVATHRVIRRLRLTFAPA